ncbi:CD177 antigen [Physeter macrocephalus]|uniref:CD177 antigen n=1 Tax=Physeter macrocephalus TaxID=9755 RepID=A0A2Y9TI76_PHYMC|nr:CD177 antigen [Physeter catodon]|eukprot:XP_023988590.1 CD177 antigen [Physeter catodon]
MTPALLLAFLGVTVPRVQALTCYSGTLATVRNTSELPLQWTTSQEDCEDGWSCQEALMLVENGPQVYVVIIKGCTQAADHEAVITQHRAGPGLSIASYTRVCRENLCNYLSNSLPLWDPPPPPAPGSVRCPVCLSGGSCESAAELTCPAESTHCYSGTLLLSVGHASAQLRVQGCTSQAGCNLLNGTQEIGPISLWETCDSEAILTCHRGSMIRTSQDLTQTPVTWSTDTEQLCKLGEVCQETLLLIDVGLTSLLVGSKGCSKAGTRDSQAISIHSGPPGVFVASFARFCSSNKCNLAASSSVLLNSLPHPAAPEPGDLQCPTCLSIFGSCTQNSDMVRCPNGTSHCYKGHVAVTGGGLSFPVNIQGCMVQPSSSLLNGTQNIGVFSMIEDHDPPVLVGAAPAPYPAWVRGLGLALALWCGAPSLLIPFLHDS